MDLMIVTDTILRYVKQNFYSSIENNNWFSFFNIATCFGRWRPSVGYQYKISK